MIDAHKAIIIQVQTTSQSIKRPVRPLLSLSYHGFLKATYAAQHNKM